MKSKLIRILFISLFTAISVFFFQLLSPYFSSAQTKPTYSQTPPCFIIKANGSMEDLSSICGKKIESDSSTINSTENADSLNPKLYSDKSLPLSIDERERFENLSRGLAPIIENSNLFKGGNGAPVVFDSTLASNWGVSPEVISLSQQMVSITNEVVASKGQSELNYSKYPLAKEYFDLATRFSRNLDSSKSKSAKNYETYDLNEKSSFIFEDEAVSKNKQIMIWEWRKASVCGTIWNPKPFGAKKYAVVSRDNRDPESTLRSWGYHKSFGLVDYRLGWTRSRTWESWACGNNTFRDNAGVTWRWVNRWPFRLATITEQNYAGWSPNGKPNPEVWNSGPWPYLTWPSYVAWWHQTF